MDLYPRVRGLLLRSDPIGSNRALKDIFVDSRLSVWRSGLPEADNELERAERAIAYLHDKFSPRGEWALQLLLLVLRDLLKPEDKRWGELGQLASELGIYHQPEQTPPIPAAWRKTTALQLDRRRILNNVRQIWIVGRLDKSLATEVRLKLAKAYRPEILMRTMVVRQPGKPDREVPFEASILDLFEQSGRSLLISGEPGVGKTFTLLELGYDLLNTAEADHTAALPVILNLASWSLKRLPLEEWLVEEMFVQYQVPRNRGRQLLEDEQLIFLLDGLDEVDPEYREECVGTLNTFFAEHLAGIAICSRWNELKQLSQPLNLGNAIFIRPLDEEQIAKFLQETGLDAVAAVRATATALKELTKLPLMLNMMALAYQDLNPSDLAGLESRKDFSHHLFRTYTERMFYHRYRAPRHSLEQAQFWLRWLAQRMVAHHQSEFDTFRMQPGWLDPAAEGRYWTGVALLGGFPVAISTALLLLSQRIPLITVLFVAFLSSLPVMLPLAVPRWRPWLEKNTGLFVGLVFGLTARLIFGTEFGLTFGSGFVAVGGVLDRAGRSRSFLRAWRRSATGVIGGLVGGLLSELFLGADGGLPFGLLIGLPFGLFGVLIDWLVQELSREMGIVENISWNIKRSLGYGLVAGTSFGLAIGAAFGLSYSLVDMLGFGLDGGLPFGLAGAFITGAQRKETVSVRPVRSWQSIRGHLWRLFWRSSLTFLLVILAVSAIVAASTAGSGIVLGQAPRDVFREVFSRFNIVGTGLGIPLLGGVVVGLAHGGLTLLRQLYLRFLIQRRGYLPRRLEEFLEEMVDILLLQRGGAGYSFRHPLLKEYLAADVRLPAD